MAADTSGNLFIADTYNNRVRKVDTNGIITTIAGNGTNGLSVDGVLATDTSLNRPYGVAADVFGNVFISDTFNSCIRKVDTNGIITTVAGGGAGGDGETATSARLSFPEGMMVDASGNLLIADSSNSRIRRVTANLAILRSAA